MTMQEIWEAKEKLSDKIWGKSADEMCEIMKPNVDEMKRKIEEIRKKNNADSPRVSL